MNDINIYFYCLVDFRLKYLFELLKCYYKLLKFLSNYDIMIKNYRGITMIIDISDSNFKRILDDKRLYLPIRWDGNDFSSTLKNLFDYYVKKFEKVAIENNVYNDYIQANEHYIKRICGLLIRAVEHYLNGFPSKAYRTFNDVMDLLMRTPLKVYQKSVMEQFEYRNNHYENDMLQLFRVTCVNDNKPYERKRVFHTPYNMRSKVSTSRYSIAGYPSLYLSTSLELCCEEIHLNPYKNFALASAFMLERTLEYTNTNIQVIELGIKPQDFLEGEQTNERQARVIPYRLLDSFEIKSAYLLWYPLISACSFIRTNKDDPFAAEYIIPQLLMQWVRSEMCTSKTDEYDHLIGIRYFSCASIKSSDMGFNYVFPTSGQQKSAIPYCPVLMKAFRLTKPQYIHEYDNIKTCERELKNSIDFDFIDAK